MFQTREADLQNAALVEFGNVPGLDYEALYRASVRETKAANEIISRMESMKSVPDAALALHRQWLVMMARHKEYSMARNAYYLSLDLDIEPDLDSVNKQKQALYDNQMKAYKEEEKLWKLMTRSGVSITERQKLIDNARRSVADENWQPAED